ncbi:MAG TPA: hypothetical protein VJ377_09975 [Dehalococcoidales bacterium]|nr:hypothetical protein [Dehalococcoidales bacterium]
MEEIWHLSHDFHKFPARDVLKNIIIDDRKNLERAESELSEDITLLDDAIVLYVESLQAAYSLIDKWKDNNSNRAAIAMIVSCFNYILLARHGILLGYYPEVCDLLRSCYERISRCYLFFHTKEFANKFLSGKPIWQNEVDKQLSKLEEDPEKREGLLKKLREYYGFLSGDAHPNLKSFEARYGGKNLGERVGLDILLGGIMSAGLGRVTIIRLIQVVLSALRILGVILPEGSGRWDKDYQKIRKKCDEMVGSL